MCWVVFLLWFLHVPLFLCRTTRHITVSLQGGTSSEERTRCFWLPAPPPAASSGFGNQSTKHAFTCVQINLTNKSCPHYHHHHYYHHSSTVITESSRRRRKVTCHVCMSGTIWHQFYLKDLTSHRSADQWWACCFCRMWPHRSGDQSQHFSVLTQLSVSGSGPGSSWWSLQLLQQLRRWVQHWTFFVKVFLIQEVLSIRGCVSDWLHWGCVLKENLQLCCDADVTESVWARHQVLFIFHRLKMFDSWCHRLFAASSVFSSLWMFDVSVAGLD